MSQPLQLLAFPLRGSQLIEASAGTGKTFTLALLYTRLILGHGDEKSAFLRPLTPREILVVTFTEAAAEELRDRIRSRLVEAAAYFRSQNAPQATSQDPLEQLKSSYPPELWAGCAWRLQLAAESMDEASISTIHSWCNRMLVEHAFDTRGLFNRELVTDTQELLTEVVQDYWRVHFYPLNTEQAALIQDSYSTPAALQKDLRGLLKTGIEGVSFQGQPLEGESLRSLLNKVLQEERKRQEKEAQAAQLEVNLRQAWLTDWPAIENYLHEIRPYLKTPAHDSKTPESYQALLDQIHSWAQGEGATPGKLKNFALGAFQFYAKSPVQEADPWRAFELQAEYNQLLEAAKKQPDTESEEPPFKTALLAHAHQWVETTFNQRLLQRAEMGFDDLLTQLEAALNPEKSTKSAQQLAKLLKNQFPVALIDEFQDTDPVQYRIFNHIYQLESDDQSTGIILIGDPKQAIYSFRGADIYTYLQAKQATQGRHFTLMRNFRSTQGVVEAANFLFGHAEQHPSGAFRFREGDYHPLPYIQVEAAGRDEQLYLDGQPANPLTFWQFAPEEGKEALGTGLYLQEAAASAASQLAFWLQAAQEGRAGFGHQGAITRSLQPSDIAILVRRGQEADAIRKELANRGLASVYLSDRSSVFATEEARDLLHWLEAVAQPGKERLVKAALATNTLDLPLSRLAAWQEQELAWEAQMETFMQLHQTWRYQGVLAMLRQLMDAYELPARRLQQNGGERSLTNLLHLAEWLQDASLQVDGEEALIRHLQEQLNTPDDQQLLRLESDARLIKVITIHKSKGLEYPLVVLPFISGWREIDGKTPQLPWRTAQGKYLEVSGKNHFPEAWKAAADERLSEDMRLLYVAITRARHALWLGVAPLKSGNSKSPQLERSALGYLLTGGARFADAQALDTCLRELSSQCPAISLEPAPAITSTRLNLQTSEVLEAARSPEQLPRLQPWWIGSYSAIRYQGMDWRLDEPLTAREATAQETTDEPREIPARPTQINADNLMQHFPAGSRYGTFLHSLMEWAAVHEYQEYRGFAAAAADTAGRLQAVTQRCQRLELEVYAEALSAWLGDFLKQPWSLEEPLVLAELSPEVISVEMEFLISCHHLNSRQLDELVTRTTLDGAPRPPAEDNLMNGLFKGFIDLVVLHQGRYYVVDWKSNRLGTDLEAYHPDQLSQAILKKRYDLQYVLYLLALHRHLKVRLVDYDYDRHLGGAIYVFMRGHAHPSQGLFHDKPPRELIETLDRLFSGQQKETQS
ncbi:DNA helicase/exodeoxyribonuclease V, beta subunit [Marinospirillum celere]|uniref:RecBCD enzyme subunit RecB n=1 Tax=Marinospirillum celere TaxID=1122252 RepID=A0A1I1EQ73_9GAMM|nr:exodeoxyribonuclease V subunit beta [Marinospirillum celere]SFB87658.1 DNA helicase/exodeoxyribonuclease V, beta subunit [Marinospirillum celere]